MKKKFIKFFDILILSGLIVSSFFGGWQKNFTEAQGGEIFIDKDTVLDHDIIGSIEIIADDITLDCNGHKIQGSGTGVGILLIDREGVTIKNCRVENFANGIVLMSEITGPFSNNFIFQNEIRNNFFGIILTPASKEHLIENNILSNTYGIFLGGSTNNEIIGNNILNNEFGIVLEGNSSNNKIYHNNFIDNSMQISLYEVIENLFDNGYPEGGNYWSDYAVKDEKSGENQDQSGSDGIGDTPYFFDGYSCSSTCWWYSLQDRYPFIKENGWETPPESKKWSFAVITDLHIGRGYSDYNGTGYENEGDGEDYYLTERLEKVVNWIKKNKNEIGCGEAKCPIQFLAVLGDIADTAEKSEFLKAKKILDKLNDPNEDGNISDGIPYVPVFGNHDVWPYTDDEEADYSQGEEFFDEIFWDENSANTKLLIEKLNFQKDEANPNYKNFAFNYKEMNFIGLDFNSRTHVPSPFFTSGVYPTAVISPETENWLKDCLEKRENCLKRYEENPYIIFSHIPFVENSTNGFSSGQWACSATGRTCFPNSLPCPLGHRQMPIFSRRLR